MRNHHILLVLFLYMPALAKNYTLSPRLGVGPSWFQFFVCDVFTLPQSTLDLESYPSVQAFAVPFSTMPQGQFQLQATAWDSIQASFRAMKAYTRNGSSEIKYIVNQGFFGVLQDIEYITQGKTNIYLTILDGTIGPCFSSKRYAISGTIFSGYSYNKNTIDMRSIKSPAEHFFKNTWQGPIIGAAMTLGKTKNLFTIQYKAIIGSMRSCYTLHAPASFFNPDQFLVPFDNTPSKWQGPVLGSAFYAEGKSYINAQCCLGTSLEYIQFRNRKNMLVRSHNRSPALITKECIKQIYWQEVIWNLWVEFLF